MAAGAPRQSNEPVAGQPGGGQLRTRLEELLASSPQQAGAPLGHAWLDSPLGPMLAIASNSHLLLLEFLERRGLEDAVRRLLRTGPVAPVIPAPLVSIERELNDYFGGRRGRFRTPVLLDGTPFQLGVWRQLQRIAPGTTLSYLQLAAAVGNPKGFRAVAQANGANRLAVIVPCHRVINADGQLGGYGAGLERKRWLLEHERMLFGAGQDRLF